MTRFVPTYIPSALETITIECKRFTAERDAFAAFYDRLNDIDTETMPKPVRPQTDAPVVLTRSASSPLHEVRRAYQETVMSVGHYDDEYDESLAENLTAEFTPEIATAVVDGEALSVPLQERLCTESQQASEQRRRILRGITHEREEVEAAHDHVQELQPILDKFLDTPVQTLMGRERAEARRDLLECEQRCEEVSAARQTSLRTMRMPGPHRGALSLEAYLYQALSVTHPVLADLAEMAEMSRTLRHRIERSNQPTDGETPSHMDRPWSVG